MKNVNKCSIENLKSLAEHRSLPSKIYTTDGEKLRCRNVLELLQNGTFRQD